MGRCCIEELLGRLEPIEIPTEVSVHIKLNWHKEYANYGLTVGNHTLKQSYGEPSQAIARLQFTLVDLVRLLFGPSHSREVAQWTHRMLPEFPKFDVNADPATQFPEDLSPAYLAAQASQVIFRAINLEENLDDLAVRFNSDKWGSVHWYTPHYNRHFQSLTEQPIRLLELGIGGFSNPDAGGGSLEMWQRYFRRGLIYGLDIVEKTVPGTRICTFQGDQNNPGDLQRIVHETGPLDIIIDDGSHINEHVLTSFTTLFPLLNTGGWYVIEDLQTSYWRGFGGNNDNFNNPMTSLGFLKTLIDGLNYQEHRYPPEHEPSYTDQHVTELHFYHNLVFIRKGTNSECGPGWLGNCR